MKELEKYVKKEINQKTIQKHAFESDVEEEEEEEEAPIEEEKVLPKTIEKQVLKKVAEQEVDEEEEELKGNELDTEAQDKLKSIIGTLNKQDLTKQHSKLVILLL